MLGPFRTLEPQQEGPLLFGDKEFKTNFFHPDWTKYPSFYELRDEIRNQFWVADEVNMTADISQFQTLSEKEKDTFLKIIGLLATLDAPQTDMAAALATHSTDPAVRRTMYTIADQESEHNHSYSYVLSSITNLDNQIHSFELGRSDEVLLKRNERIVEIYNNFVQNPTTENALKAMVYTSLLEGMYFYSAFAFFYFLASKGKMIGTKTMIAFINKDELQHARFISELFRATINENPEFNTEEFAEWVYDEYRKNVELESEWSSYVLDGVKGIYLPEMLGYIKYRANKMLRMLGLSEIYPEHTENPMKWISAFVDNFDGVKTDFFEQQSRQYTSASEINGLDDL